MDVQDGYMMKKIMMDIVVASLPPEWKPHAVPTVQIIEKKEAFWHLSDSVKNLRSLKPRVGKF